jgi:hypothetical protein
MTEVGRQRHDMTARSVVDIVRALNATSERCSSPEAWRSSHTAAHPGPVGRVTEARTRAPFVSREDLLEMKRKAGRPRDLEDIRALEALGPQEPR